jgi:hypothetical protein
MAFDNVVFPQIACRDVTKSESLPLQAVGNGTIQSRSTPVRWGQFGWSISSVGMTNTDKLIVKSFLRRRQYGLNSFKYTDPDYPEMIEDVMGHESGERWYLYLSEFDESGAKVPGLHPVFHPNLLDLTLTVDGNPTAFSFSIQNGQPILNIPGTVGTELIKVSGEYYLSVILGSTLGWTIAALEEDSTPHSVRTADFTITEVFEY